MQSERPLQISQIPSSERLVPRRLLRRLVPVSDMTIYRWERDGLFPRHLEINGRNYWRQSEIDDWFNRQPKSVGLERVES